VQAPWMTMHQQHPSITHQRSQRDRSALTHRASIATRTDALADAVAEPISPA
jgi:hypothetical protein